MSSRPKTIVSWSSGKDSAYALHVLRQEGKHEIVGLLTTITSAYQRVSMHGVREKLLDLQAHALGLPVYKIGIPSPCPNETYEREMSKIIETLRFEGVTHLAFGDLFLADIRAYREERLAGTGITPIFPLWQRPTETLAREILGSGIRARLSCVDSRKLDPSFAGREFDEKLLRDLPPGVDPCGENGEFHTVVYAGPMFAYPIEITSGPVVDREGFVFADVIPSPRPVIHDSPQVN